MRPGRRQFTIGSLMGLVAIMAFGLAGPSTTIGLFACLVFIIASVGLMILVVGLAILVCLLLVTPSLYIMERLGSRGGLRPQVRR